MKVTKRGVNIKRHTTQWLVGGKWRTRSETVDLALQGKVEGVSVRRGSNDELYIASLPKKSRLYDLPTKILV